jgi:hypothetical protein
MTIIGWVSAAAALIGFFLLPWLRFPPATAKKFSSRVIINLHRETARPWWHKAFFMNATDVNNALNRPLEGVRGAAIAALYQNRANRWEIYVLNNSGLLGSQRQQDRATLLYGFPVLVVFAALFVQIARRKLALLVALLSCAGAYALLRWQLSVTDFERLASGPDLGLGFWISLYALLGLTTLLLARLVTLPGSRA